MIPKLEWMRPRLRPWRLADFEVFAALRTGDELQSFVGGAETVAEGVEFR